MRSERTVRFNNSFQPPLVSVGAFVLVGFLCLCGLIVRLSR
jgi:hypothetical protein